MTTRVGIGDEVIETAGRAAVYSLLAAGFGIPGEQRLSQLRSRLLPAVSVIGLPAPVDGLLATLPSTLPRDIERFRDDHMALFPPIASRDAPGYETAYRGDDIFQQADLLADVAGFYKAHGLRAGGSERERPDHITVELEFMAVLARKTLHALRSGRSEDAEICDEMSALFLRDHLGCWGPGFGRRVAAMSTSPWYRNLGELLAAWVELHIDAEGVTPVEVVDDPLPFEAPDDGMCSPCGVFEGGPAT